MGLVLLLFAIVKKKGYFKCDKHIYDKQDIATLSTQVLHLRKLMVDKSGIDFKLAYTECHVDKDSHQMMASMINYILAHKCNKYLKHTTFQRMNEVETMFHHSPQVKSNIEDLLILFLIIFRATTSASGIDSQTT